jgi:hypothetical protein
LETVPIATPAAAATSAIVTEARRLGVGLDIPELLF